jgi:hypothetical protein
MSDARKSYAPTSRADAVFDDEVTTIEPNADAVSEQREYSASRYKRNRTAGIVVGRELGYGE